MSMSGTDNTMAKEQIEAPGLTEKQKKFRERAKNEIKRKAEILNLGYYLSIWFSTYPELDGFCHFIGANPDELYVDGRAMMARLNLPIQAKDQEWPRIRGYDKDYAALAMDFDPKHCRRRSIPTDQATKGEPATMDELEASLMNDFARLYKKLSKPRPSWDKDYAYYKAHRPIKKGLFSRWPKKCFGVWGSYYDLYIWFTSIYQYHEFMTEIGLDPTWHIISGAELRDALEERCGVSNRLP